MESRQLVSCVAAWSGSPGVGRRTAMADGGVVVWLWVGRGPRAGEVMTPTSVSFRGQGQGWRTFFHPPIFPLAAAPFFGRWLWVVAGCVRVTSAVFSIFILYLGAAKNKPITVTDVQSDGRPLAIPRDPRGALLLLVCDAVAAVGPLSSVLIINSGNSGLIIICPTSTAARSPSYSLKTLTFVGARGLFTTISTCAALACAPNGFGGEKTAN